jgi:hypothetical protein
MPSRYARAFIFGLAFFILGNVSGLTGSWLPYAAAALLVQWLEKHIVGVSDAE